MMLRGILTLSIPLLLSSQRAFGFCPLASSFAKTRRRQRGASLKGHDGGRSAQWVADSTSSNVEVSRRVALVTAAALAAGASPAQAATLQRTVETLEKQNIDEVNTKGAPEKHLPKVSADGNEISVVVPHVMDPEKPHFIEYIWLKDVESNNVVAVKAFKATDPGPPTLVYKSTVAAATLKPMLFCNLHGLWEGDTFSV